MITPEIVAFIFNKMNFDDNEEMAEEFVSYLQFYYSITMEIKPTMARLREVHRVVDYVRGVDYSKSGEDHSVVTTRQGGKITKVEVLTKRPQDPDPILTIHEMEQEAEAKAETESRLDGVMRRRKELHKNYDSTGRSKRGKK